MDYFDVRGAAAEAALEGTFRSGQEAQAKHGDGGVHLAAVSESRQCRVDSVLGIYAGIEHLHQHVTVM